MLFKLRLESVFQASRWLLIGCYGLAFFCLASSAIGQTGTPPVRHYFSGGNAIPGEVAFQALLTNPHWQSRIQPAKIVVPAECTVAVWNQFQFEETIEAHPTVGVAVGPIYRFRITGIPEQPGVTIYPSLELINQLTPPEGLAMRFPVPLNFSMEDLRAAAEGRMVMKVVYVENPETALPYRQIADDQPFFDIGDSEDALRTAERLGRPIAILRLGSRVPTSDELNAAYSASGIPLTVFPASFSEQLAQQKLTAEQVSFSRESSRQDCQPSPQFNQCNACPQWPGFSCPPTLWPTGMEVMESGKANRDEFLCDGGDRNFKIKVRENGDVGGLDLEDTVGHFRTFDGLLLTTESNQVCIYSPRFAAVRKVSQTVMTEKIARLSSFAENVELEGTRGQEFSSTTLQNLQPRGHNVASRTSNFVDQTRGVLADQVLIPEGFTTRFQAYENLALMRYGKHRNSESARLNVGMQSANVWLDQLGLQVAEKNIQPVITRDPLRVQEIAAVETETKSQLRLCKIADKIAAAPGDIIEFTLRFDNIGAKVIDKVTIIDNLTTRLEYVEDSSECSMNAKFSFTENEGSSLKLQWEITDPIAVGKGGIIRFKCRVR
ncbi:MAG: hypothetical protein KF851_06675 [Pirellulaceae bacterium]|nr:hypothetical protein [Pirellulaceae bacterium]